MFGLAVASDEFELRLGLLRTARNEWAQTTGASRAALTAYSQGVNDDIAEVRSSGDWPALFSLSGQYPRDWTPVDSLVVQGMLTQELDYTTGPLDMALIDKSPGSPRTADWFPTTAENTQTPYDPGPYVKLPLTPLAPDAASSVPRAVTTGAGATAVGGAAAGSGSASLTAAVVAAAGAGGSSASPTVVTPAGWWKGAVAGWAIALWKMALDGLPVGATGTSIAALAGLPPYAAVAIAVTLLLAALQALAGTWLARAVFPRQVRLPFPRRHPQP